MQCRRGVQRRGWPHSPAFKSSRPSQHRKGTGVTKVGPGPGGLWTGGPGVSLDMRSLGPCLGLRRPKLTPPRSCQVCAPEHTGLTLNTGLEGMWPLPVYTDEETEAGRHDPGLQSRGMEGGSVEHGVRSPRLSVTWYASRKSFMRNPMTSTKSSTSRNSSLALGPIWRGGEVRQLWR